LRRKWLQPMAALVWKCWNKPQKDLSQISIHMYWNSHRLPSEYKFKYNVTPSYLVAKLSSKFYCFHSGVSEDSGLLGQCFQLVVFIPLCTTGGTQRVILWCTKLFWNYNFCYNSNLKTLIVLLKLFKCVWMNREICVKYL
jgi:hypothetical protein